MRRYIIRRVWEMVPTTFGILLLTFLLFHVVGGSPAQVVLGKNATAESLAAFDAKYGYDKPLFLGHWARIRALEDRRADPARGARRDEVPLAYALPAGQYRLRVVGSGGFGAPAARVTFRGIEGVETRTNVVAGVRRGNSMDFNFNVPDGCRATALALDEHGQRLSLRRRTAHFLDSQLALFLGGLARGDFGDSAEYGMPVARVLRNGLGPSLAVTLPILVGGTVLAIMFGLLCAMWRGQGIDRTILLVSTVLMSVNYIIWVLAGQYLLAFRLHLFPIWGFENWTYVLLPALIGIVAGLGRDIRFFRAVILDEIYKPYVRTAWAKGLSPMRVMVRHVLRNSLIPIVTYVSLSIPFLITGSLLLESFYGIPGLGCVSLNAMHSSDMSVVRALVIVGALLYQAVNLLTDLCYAWLDPRVRLG